jgi:Zn-dependent protease
VLAWLLPRSMQGTVDFLARYGGIILLLLIITPSLGRVFGSVIGYPINVITTWFLFAINLGVGS